MAATLLTRPIVVESPTSGFSRSAEATRSRSPKVRVRTGSLTGRRTEGTLHIVPRKVMAGSISRGLWEAQVSSARSRPLATFPFGRQMARRYCFRLILIHLVPTGSTSCNLMGTRHAKCWRNYSHKRTFRHCLLPGVQMERELAFGWAVPHQVPTSG